jgi:NAD(P)-dependent dehydrogenase (short-subunit alcohol dehydrogenase family)
MTTALFSLSGETALVTGAAGGLGFAIAGAMADAGANLVLSDIDPDRCAASAARLEKRGVKVWAAAANLASASERQSLVDRAVEQAGRIGILVCNAGIQGPAGPMGDIDDEAFRLVMEVNLRAAIDLSAGLIPAMAEAGGGSVIFVASIAGIRGNKSIGLYGLSKAALAQLARNLAVEWGPHNVRVNAISPGLIRTPLAQDLMANEPFMERRLGLTPLRRVGEPEEIAGVAVMLAGRAGGFITGQNIVVDGGTTISDGS